MEIEKLIEDKNIKLTTARRALLDIFARATKPLSYEDIKSPYDEEYTKAHPNAVSGLLDTLEVKFGIQVIYTSQFRPLAEEKAASWLSKHFTYWYLEENGFGRVLQEGDL